MQYGFGAPATGMPASPSDDLSEHPVVIVRLDGTLLYGNPAMSKLFRMAQNQIPNSQVLSLTAPEDQDSTQTAIQKLIQGESSAMHLIKTYVSPSGSRMRSLVTATLIPDYYGMGCVLRAELRTLDSIQAKPQTPGPQLSWSAIWRGSPVATALLISASMSIAYANPSMCEFLRFPRLEKQSLYRFLDRENATEFYNAVCHTHSIAPQPYSCLMSFHLVNGPVVAARIVLATIPALNDSVNLLMHLQPVKPSEPRLCLPSQDQAATMDTSALLARLLSNAD